MLQLTRCNNFRHVFAGFVYLKLRNVSFIELIDNLRFRCLSFRYNALVGEAGSDSEDENNSNGHKKTSAGTYV